MIKKIIQLITLVILTVLSIGSVSAQETSFLATIDPIGYLKTEPSENSKTLTIIPLGDSVIVDGTYYSSPYFKVDYKGATGYLSIASFALKCDLIKIVNKNSSSKITGFCDEVLDSHDANHGASSTHYANDCQKTSNCGCSGKRKNECYGNCCQWIVGTGCVCK